MKARLLHVVLGDPYSNLALEETLFRMMDQPVLRVWENQKSVVIGRAQKAEFETDVGYCKKSGIPVVRRMSGGGAVYHGPGNINWSFFVPAGAGPLGREKGAKRVFETFAGVVVAALARSGVASEFSPPNSIVGGDGKVCGMAAYVSRRGVLCHGTLLVNADLDEVRRLTRPSVATIERRYTRSRFAEVANCGADGGRLAEALGETSGYDLEESELTDGEGRGLATLLPRYQSERWNLGDPFELDDV